MSRRVCAIVLCLALLFTSASGCSLAKLAERAPTKRTVTINPLFFRQGPEGPEGGFSKAKITVETNPSHELRVGFFEDEVGGAGPQWKAAGWMAAIMGAFLLGRDVSEYKFTIDTAGYIDGPSAGAAMTVAVLSALLGDDIKKDVTMTGTINPDGTIGPVGGIPQKLDGAKKARKKTVLVPLGQRYDYDEKTEQDVDVVSLGSKKGIKVKEVGNIYEAYKELTGKELPKPDGAGDDKVDLPSDAYDKVKARATRWYGKYQEERAKYVQGALPADLGLDAWINLADAMAAKGDKYLKQGLVASAYTQVAYAALYANMAYNAQQSVAAYINGGLKGAVDYLDRVSPSTTKMAGMLDELKTKKPATMADIMVISSAYAELADGSGLINLADNELKNAGANDAENMKKILTATLYYALAGFSVDVADDVIAVGMGTGKTKPADRAKVKRLSEAFRKAAEANIDYFDNVLLKEVAEANGESMSITKDRFMTADISYAFAVSAIQGAAWLKEELGNTNAAAYAVMGNSMDSFLMSSELIAKYYSLAVQTDDDGNISGVAREKALIEMLDFGEGKAAEDINAAKKAGAEPVLAILNYESGKVSREGDVSEKISALGDFWWATMQSKALLTLSEMKVRRAGAGGEIGSVKVMGD